MRRPLHTFRSGAIEAVKAKIQDDVTLLGVTGTYSTSGTGLLSMTISSTTTVSPAFVAATLAPADFLWIAPNGTWFTGKAPAGSNFVTGGVGTYRVYCTNWAAVTAFACDADNVTALDVAVATALTTLEVYSNPLTTLDVSANIALATLDCNTTSLTTLDIGSNVLLSILQAPICSLTVAAVDAILAAIVAASVDGGTLNLFGQLPSGAIPGEQGQLDVATLEAVAPGRAWTVTVD